MKNIRFNLDRGAGLDLLANNKRVQDVMFNSMENVIPVIEAQFFQTFGTEGKFVVKDFATDRYTAKISPANDKTEAILFRNPKWLSQFIDNINI